MIEEPYRVLFADTFPYRHRQFMVKSGNSKRPVIQSHVYSTGEFILALGRDRYNVVFVPGYFDREDDFKEIIREIIKAFNKRGAPDLVIYHGNEDSFHLCKQLKAVGIPVAHVPWNFLKPSEHVRVEVK